MAEKIDGLALGCIAIGGGLAYAGIAGKSIPSLIQGFVTGKSPSSATAANAIQQVTETGAGSTVAPDAGSTVAPDTSLSGYSQAQIQQLWIAEGGASDTAAFAAQVAMSESSGLPDVTSSNPDGGTNAGLFQLDTKGVGAGYSVAQLQDPGTSTQITIMATGNGINWREWSDPVVNALPGHQYTPGG